MSTPVQPPSRHRASSSGRIRTILPSAALLPRTRSDVLVNVLVGVVVVGFAARVVAEWLHLSDGVKNALVGVVAVMVLLLKVTRMVLAARDSASGGLGDQAVALGRIVVIAVTLLSLGFLVMLLFLR
jgi:hypothetical protein